jgi:hypothetical protein
MTERMGQPEQDRQNRTGQTRLMEQFRQNWQAEQDRQNRTGRTGQAEQDKQNGTGRAASTWLLG